MKKPLILLTALVAVAFVVITIRRWRSAEGSGPGADVTEGTRQRIKTFWALYNNANTLRAQGKFAEAAAAYRKSLELNPHHEDSLYYLGTSLYELGDYAEAAATFRKMIELNPASGRALSQLGNTLSVLAPGAPADFEQARTAYLRNVEINREQAGPFLRLGMLDLNQGRADAALENFRLAAGFGSPDAGFLVAYTLFLQRKNPEAIPFLRKVLESYGRDKKITGRGVLSEGDVLPGPGKPLTALEKAGLKSILLLYWDALRLGGYPAGIPNEFHVSGVEVSGRQQDSAFREPHSTRADVGLKPVGGRAAWADFDKDGRADLVVVGLGQPLVLYRHQGGKLVDVTGASGLKGVRNVWDAVWVDYDLDGYPDLYLVRNGFMGRGQNLLYHNNRNGTFTDVTAVAGLQGERATARALFVDLGGGGRPDLLEVGSADQSHGSLRLFRNLGNRFVEQTGVAGLVAAGTAVDCAVGDYDGDGKPDLFVLFWQRGGILYHNLGNGRFSDATEHAGLRDVGGQGFSTLFFDYDNDGRLDLLVTTQAPFEDVVRCLLQPRFRFSRNTPRLFRNKGEGSFEDVTARVGLDRCYGTMQALASDIDADGWTDLILVNGSLDAQRLEPSIVLRNMSGKEFREWFYLPGIDEPGNFIGAALVDFNADGVPDIYLAQNSVLRDNPTPSGLFLSRRGHPSSAFSASEKLAAKENSTSPRR